MLGLAGFELWRCVPVGGCGSRRAKDDLPDMTNRTEWELEQDKGQLRPHPGCLCVSFAPGQASAHACVRGK